jgi:hypothetical protein
MTDVNQESLDKATAEAEAMTAKVLEDIAATSLSAPLGDRYNRYRPFLVVSMTGVPQRGAKTSEKGWSEKANAWNVLESPVIVDRVSNKMMTEASVIIDILNTKVVKNRYGNDEEVVKYYLGKYSAEISESIRIWSKQMSAVSL